MKQLERCFACDKVIKVPFPRTAITDDGAQRVYVGRECYKNIEKSKEQGWQPPKGGPKLYLERYKRRES